MLDYKFIKDNLEAVKENIKNRNMVADADKVVELYDKRTELVTKLQGLQQKRNENAQAMKQKLDNDKRQELIAAGKAIKEEIAAVETESKEVEALGAFPVPVEVIPQASRMVMKALEDMGAKPEIRMAERKDGPVISDNGNFIIDAKFDEIESPLHLEIDLNTIPGVVENGLFTEMVDKVILGTKDGIKEL